MKSIRIMFAAAALLFATQSFAHEAKGPNGGRIVDAANYHVELVVKGTQVDVFVTDGNDKSVDVSGFKALALLNAGGKVQRVALEVKEKSKLSGQASAALSSSVKGVVQLTLPDGKTAQGQYK